MATPEAQSTGTRSSTSQLKSQQRALRGRHVCMAAGLWLPLQMADLSMYVYFNHGSCSSYRSLAWAITARNEEKILNMQA